MTKTLLTNIRVSHPYLFEPNQGEEEFSDSSQSSTSDEEEIDQDFETANSWRLSTLDWCKCGNCSVMDKTVESFCCHEKATEYDEYNEKLTNAENQGFQCITNLTSFQQNMLSKEVLHIDVLQYMEENWPLDDKELDCTHKLYRLASYRRCSRWVFTILGKKAMTSFPFMCIFAHKRSFCFSKCVVHTFQVYQVDLPGEKCVLMLCCLIYGSI